MLKVLLISLIPVLGNFSVVRPKAAVYRYNKDATKTHYYTTNKNELGESKNGFELEGIGFYISTKSSKYCMPFLVYANGNDYIYTASFDKDIIPSKERYRVLKRLGYIYTTNVKGTVPLYKYYSQSLKRHFYTITFSEIGKQDRWYDLQGIAGYVFDHR